MTQVMGWYQALCKFPSRALDCVKNFRPDLFVWPVAGVNVSTRKNSFHDLRRNIGLDAAGISTCSTLYTSGLRIVE